MRINVFIYNNILYVANAWNNNNFKLSIWNVVDIMVQVFAKHSETNVIKGNYYEISCELL
jgi:hypothetical protein